MITAMKVAEATGGHSLYATHLTRIALNPHSCSTKQVLLSSLFCKKQPRPGQVTRLRSPSKDVAEPAFECRSPRKTGGQLEPHGSGKRVALGVRTSLLQCPHCVTLGT